MAISKEEFEELQQPVEVRILQIFDVCEASRLTTSSIRKHITMSHQTLLNKLDEMVEKKLLSKTVEEGSRVFFWDKLVSASEYSLHLSI